MKKKEVLGIDLGDTIFDRSVSPTQPFQDALRVIKRLTEERFTAQHVHIVSKVNAEQMLRAEARLAEYGFFEATGIPEENLHFCAERSEKAPICERLGITHFIDDRVEVIYHLLNIVPHCYLFRGNTKRKLDTDELEFEHVTRETRVVNSWLDIEELLLK